MAEKKAAFYAGTRNLYPHMVTAAKSLYANSTVDEIWFLIEDDEFPEKLPKVVKTMNVSGQKFFSPNGPNYSNGLTYMVMMHVCACSLFPQYDKILKLDVDTICVSDIDPVWYIDMTGMWYAMAHEDLQKWYRPHDDGTFYSAGVILYNLKQMREEGAEERIVTALNTKYYKVCEQEALNMVGHYRIKRLPLRYNESFATGYTDDPAIVHYAGPKDWYSDDCNKVARKEHLKPYRDMTWKEAARRHELLVKRRSP